MDNLKLISISFTTSHKTYWTGCLGELMHCHGEMGLGFLPSAEIICLNFIVNS